MILTICRLISNNSVHVNIIFILKLKKCKINMQEGGREKERKSERERERERAKERKREQKRERERGGILYSSVS